jgi:hypothetical protein
VLVIFLFSILLISDSETCLPIKIGERNWTNHQTSMFEKGDKKKNMQMKDGIRCSMHVSNNSFGSFSYDNNLLLNTTTSIFNTSI